MALTNTEIEALNDSVISAWNFDEGSGTTAFDEKGSNDGTIYGATWTTGKIGSALNFDGSNDYMTTPPAITSNTDFTFSFWIKTTYTGVDLKLFLDNRPIGLVDPRIFLGIENSKLRVFHSDGTAYNLYSNSNISTGNWTHITITKNGTTNKIYINSVEDASGASTSNTIFNSDDWIFGCGRDNNGARTLYADIELDAFTVISGATLQDEIDYLYNSGAGRQYPYS